MHDMKTEILIADHLNIDVLITSIIMMFWTRHFITETLIKVEMLQYDEMRNSALWAYIGSLSLKVFKICLIRNVQNRVSAESDSKHRTAAVCFTVKVDIRVICYDEVIWGFLAFHLGWMCSHGLNSYFYSGEVCNFCHQTDVLK